MDCTVPFPVRVNRPRDIFPKALVELHCVHDVAANRRHFVAARAEPVISRFDPISGLVVNCGKPPNSMQFFKALHWC
jgi:hypothetical protein